MKILLTSYRLPRPDLLFGLLPRANASVAVIPNAKDYYAERARKFKLNETCEFIKSLGLNPEIVDLSLFSEPAKLRERLQTFDMLWVSGGNTFCLRYQARRSGFDQVLPTLLKQGVVYAGESAGACLLGTTLKGLEAGDQPEFAEEIIWEGLSIIPYFILPHTDNPWMVKDTAYARNTHAGEEIVELTDSETYIFDGEKGKTYSGPTKLVSETN
jgi:dipeptidase E